MASVYPKQGKWWLKYRDATGRVKNIPTTCDTKTAAKRLARELEQKVERQRLGLEPMPVAQVISFGAAMDLWWAENKKLLRSHTIQGFAERHLRKPLGHLVLGEVTEGVVERLLNSKVDELAPQSRNHLHSYIKRIFNFCSRRGLWRGHNPASNVKKARIPKRKPPSLTVDQVAAVLRFIPGRVLAIFLVAFYTAMRKGEILALRKEDVNLADRVITVRRSNHFDTTKGQHEDELPICDELLPHLESAMQKSKSDLVFPRADGKQHPADFALHKIFRRALGKAGVVIAYRHACRRKGCGFEERRSTNEASRCPKCAMKLWVSPIPRPLRFHDIRHSTASLLLKSGVPLAIVQKVLRHSDPAITVNVYGGIELADMKQALDGLSGRVHPALRIVSGEKNSASGC